MGARKYSNTGSASSFAAEREVKTTLLSRNVTVLGRRTSVRLEPEMWDALHDIAKREMCSIHDVCSLIGLRKNTNTSLTAAIRVFIMLYYKSAATDAGHAKAGHGNFEYMKMRARVTAEEWCGGKRPFRDFMLLNGAPESQELTSAGSC